MVTRGTSIGPGVSVPGLRRVISSSVGSHSPRAVARRTGIDADDIAAGLVELLDDPTRRAELSAAAQRRAKDFSWATSATLHWEAYSHAVAARRRSR